MAESCMTAAGAPDDRRRSRYPMINVEDAIVHVLQNTSALPLENVGLTSTCGRVVAADVAARDPFPSFRASIMDGYAVCGNLEPGIYPVQQRIHAGDPSEILENLNPGSVVYITTGAMVPEGANAVVKIEDTSSVKGEANADSTTETKVEIAIKVTEGANIRQIGCDIKAGITATGRYPLQSSPTRFSCVHSCRLICCIDFITLPFSTNHYETMTKKI